MKVTQAMLDAAKRAAPELPIVSLDDALNAALADVPEPSRNDNVEDFASDLVCKYHGLDRGYGKYQELKAKMIEALAFVVRMRDGGNE